MRAEIVIGIFTVCSVGSHLVRIFLFLLELFAGFPFNGFFLVDGFRNLHFLQFQHHNNVVMDRCEQIFPKSLQIANIKYSVLAFFKIEKAMHGSLMGVRSDNVFVVEESSTSLFLEIGNPKLARVISKYFCF